MPQIPVFDDVVTVRAPGAAHASPEAFAAPWQALARGGQEFSNEMAAFNQRYAEAKRQADAAKIVADGTEKLGDMQFRWGQLADRDKAIAGFKDEADKYQAEKLNSITDPLIKAHVIERFATQRASRLVDVGNEAFARESSQRKGELDEGLLKLQNAYVAATDDSTRASVLADANAWIDGHAAGGWITPEDRVKRRQAFVGGAEAAGIQRAMNAALDVNDPDKSAEAFRQIARDISDPSKHPDLTPERREALTRSAQTAEGIQTRRAIAKLQHEDVVADRNMRRAQAANEAIILSQIYAGQGTPSDSDIARMAAGGQITAGAVQAFHAAKDREEDGRDNPLVAAHLYQQMGDGDLRPDDVYAAFQHGDVSKTTMTTMIRGLASQANKGDNALARGELARLKTAFGGQAIEQNLVDLTKAEPARRVAAYGQALGQYNQRVVQNGENPTKVVNELLEQYQGALNIPAPTWLPKPRSGVILSEDDLNNAARKLGADYLSKRITQDEFQREGQILSQYRQFYLQRNAAGLGGAMPKPAGAK